MLMANGKLLIIAAPPDAHKQRIKQDARMLAVEPVSPALEIEDGRLRIRPWQQRDADGLFEAARESLDSVGRWLPWCHADYRPSDATAWIEHCTKAWLAGEHFAFSIFDRITGEFVGGVGLNQINRAHRSANLGYWVRQSRQGQGIAASAAMLAARFGFERLGLVRLEIVTLPDNRSSRRTAETLGARFEAMARQRLWMHGQAMDAAVYALIPQDLA
jgi:ribosomal-protein-serine acetyltransferase